MAYFKSNKVETRIANILKGTSDPISHIGDNGQLYLKYYNYSNDYSFREYLEVTSSGPYINTEVACTSNAYFEVDFNFTGSHSESRVFGCGTGGGAMFLIQNYNFDYMSVGESSESNVYQIPDAGNRHKYKANADGIYVDDVLVDTNVQWNNALPQRHYNLFAIDWDGTDYYATNARVYSCRIWNGTKIVRYLIPALRKSDDVVGMLDIVNGIFYTNDGSGSFVISSTEINISNTIIDSFAKVNGQWQNLIGTNINDIQSEGSPTQPTIIHVFNDVSSENSTYTILEDGLYLIEVSTSYSGTRSITLPSGRTPIVNEVISGDNRGITIEIVELKSGDEITLSATVSQWVSFSKSIFLLRNIEVLNVYDTDYADDTTLTYNSIPNTDDYYMTVAVCFGRQENNYYDGTVNTQIPLEQEDFSGTMTLGSIRLDKGKNFPELSYYGYDGGGAYLCVLNVRVQEEAEPTVDTSKLLFKDGNFYNQDILKVGLYKGQVSGGELEFTGLRAGFLIEEINLPQGITGWAICFKLRVDSGQSLQCGTCQPNLEAEDLYNIISYGTNRITYNGNNLSQDTNYYYRLNPANSYSNSVFIGDSTTSGEHSMVFYIEEMTMDLYDGPQIIRS